MVILPLDGDQYQAVCESCRWSFIGLTEPFAEEMAEAHERFARHQEAKAALARYAALPPAVNPNDLHTHSPACTFEVCGVGPTRAELIARRHGRYPALRAV